MPTSDGAENAFADYTIYRFGIRYVEKRSALLMGTKTASAAWVSATMVSACVLDLGILL